MGKRMLCVWERRKLVPAVATVGCFCFSHLASALCREDSLLIIVCSVMCCAFGSTSLNPVWAQESGFINWLWQEWGWPAPLSGSSPLSFRTPAAWLPAWMPAGNPSYQPTALLVWCQIQREEGGVGRWSSEEKWYCVRSQAYVSFSVDFSVNWKKKMWSGSGDVFYSGYNFYLLLYQVFPTPSPLCICRNNLLLWDFYRIIRLKKFY